MLQEFNNYNDFQIKWLVFLEYLLGFATGLVNMQLSYQAQEIEMEIQMQAVFSTVRKDVIATECSPATSEP